MNETVLVLTTAHWEGDPRLNRHVRYMQEAGVEARILAIASTTRGGRIRNVWRAMTRLWKERPYAVILPDPELFLPGAIVARLRGTVSVIDVHEDYGKAAYARDWLPGWLRPIVGFLASANDWLGRRVAHTTLVAAPELEGHDSVLVLNTPNPADFAGTGRQAEATVVYVGDVTEARGALTIAELARRMPDVRFLVIGRIDPALSETMYRASGPGNLDLAGRLPHGRAWAAAAGSLAGLSLLEDLPAYHLAVATKLWEYCAAGVPPVVTDLPGQRSFVERIDRGLVVRDLDEAENVIRRLGDDRAWAEELVRKGRRIAAREWSAHRPDLALQDALLPRPITRSDTPSDEN